MFCVELNNSDFSWDRYCVAGECLVSSGVSLKRGCHGRKSTMLSPYNKALLPNNRRGLKRSVRSKRRPLAIRRGHRRFRRISSDGVRLFKRRKNASKHYARSNRPHHSPRAIRKVTKSLKKTAKNKR